MPVTDLSGTAPIEGVGEGLPELPAISPSDALPYSAIRYVAGYPASYVQAYAKAYAARAVLAERERCARIVEGERLCDQTGSDGDAGYELAITHCAAAIRAVEPHP